MGFTHAEIRGLLPHRFPILLVDRVLDVVPGRSLRAIKCVTANEPCFERVGDAADEAACAYPATLLLESFLQAAGLFFVCSVDLPQAAADSVMLFGSLGRCTFLRPVMPGEVVEHRVSPERMLSDSGVLSGASFVGDECVAEFEQAIVAIRPRAVMG
jgi:3-hydroxyacyl-[acyl-carrier-protein] dehydratase